MRNKKVRILSLDGGGIRGIIPATVLKYVEEKLIEITKNPNTRIVDYFDMIVGTSTGGILACFYLTPNLNAKSEDPVSKFTASTALDFYCEKGYKIFNGSKKRTWFGLRQIFYATKYSPKNLENIFQQEFNNLKMSELLKPCIVTTYDMKSKTAFFFNSSDSLKIKSDFYVRDVVRSTSAAPTYFPPAIVKGINSDQYMYNLDGGVFANNPTMCAYAECRKTKFKQIDYPGAENMLILSIGTGGGQIKFPDLKKSPKWGVINWAESVPEIMMDGSIDTVNHQLGNLFATLKKEHVLNYKRINVPIGKRNYSTDMADASEENIKKLKKAGVDALESAQIENKNEHTLDKFIELLIENAP